MLEYLTGKRSTPLCAADLRERAARYADVLLDLGTGDGRFVRHVAARRPDLLVIGLDASRDSLRQASHKAPKNALFLAANTLEPPAELAGLDGLVSHLTIHFPWGSLLDGLLHGHPRLLALCTEAMRPGANLEVWLNAGALGEQGFALEDGVRTVRRALESAGFDIGTPVACDASDLRACPTTWAHRLAFGRDPRAFILRGKVAGAWARSSMTPNFVGAPLSTGADA